MECNDCKYTLLVCSCDVYEDLWDPFFKLLHIQWKKCPATIMLSTETKNYTSEYFQIQSVHPTGRTDMPWGRRFRQAIKEVKTPYVLVLLDDFFLSQPVDQEKVDQCVNWMEEEKDIVNFTFVPSPWNDIPSARHPGFELRPKGALYRVRLQAGLWRRDMLLKLIKPYESPWDFEWFGNCRAELMPWKYYAQERKRPWAFEYDFEDGGGGLHRGKWAKKVVSLFEEHNIKIDFDKRGWDDSPAPPLGGERAEREDNRKPEPVIKALWHAYIKPIWIHRHLLWKAYF